MRMHYGRMSLAPPEIHPRPTRRLTNRASTPSARRLGNKKPRLGGAF